ncbi:nuclear exosome regulator NRDE2 [Macadamia integrifolia]|uniref:nuclear exosome regulator NRDE2 n=1 Tax=Macadamia integrifolia TaxID=60698 RepID=UPI001C4EC2E0|nr:nuclear exosome regulator NRDE2 [Macadamia integrifolia]
MEEAGETGEMNAREAEEEPKPSLFPLFPLSDSSLQSTSKVPQWLYNPSFTTDLSVVQESLASRDNITSQEREEGEDDEEIPQAKPPPYDLLKSSASDEDRDTESRRERRGEKNKKKKRKRRRSREQADDDYSSRKSAVHAWAGSDTKPAKDYYFDSRGDRDNLAFGSLYRMDVARYKLHNSSRLSESHTKVWNRWKNWDLLVDGDEDIDALDGKLRSGGRYWSTKFSALERHREFKRVRIFALDKSLMVPGEFIPLDETSSESADGRSPSKMEVIEESWDDEVLRKTKEFNKISRECPHDERVWLAFAEFQDKIASRQPQKAARLQTLEKKISILEKATELNPDNEELLLCLLKGYQRRDSAEVLIERWQKILMQHSGSCKLWKGFLHVMGSDFSRFKVSDMRRMYANAIQALSTTCAKLCRQVHQTVKPLSVDSSVVQLEQGLVDIFVSLCRFEWQAGYQELATALFQAEIECSLFCPSLLLTEQSKQRLSEHFWNSEGARLGEEGALGWSTWLEKEEENRQKIIAEESAQENEGGGWTGWSEPLSRNNVTSKDSDDFVEDAVGVNDAGEEFETEDVKLEDDIEDLLKKLGIDVETGVEGEVKDTATWTRWSEEELSRDSEQWMPVREKYGASRTNDALDREGDEQLLRVILFEDVSEFLFSLSSEEARFSLICQFIDFYGGKISSWTSTNSSSWIENNISLEALPDSILEDLRKIHEVVNRSDGSSSNFNLEFLLGSSTDVSRRTSMMKFLRNAILLCLTAFPRNHIMEEAALAAEELFMTRMNSCICTVTPSRALARTLLKNDRQDILLCGVYARSEAVFGNIDLARKVFDMALGSLEGLQLELQSNSPLLYFWYAEVELANCRGSSLESSSSRAVHILSCLGSGVKYSPFTDQPSSLQLLRAHQGFKERIRALRSGWARGDIKDHAVALICSAALFEDLTSGWAAGIKVLEEAFSMVLPERRHQSSQLESLYNYYIRMLQKHHKQLKLSAITESILQGLQIYPYNPKLFAAFMEISYLYTVPNKLRWIFDDFCHKKPSVIVWLFALSFEMGRGGSRHRIHGLFERALSNDMLHNSVILWRLYIAYEMDVASNPFAAKRIFFRAIHACPWSKKLWLDGFLKLNSILTAKELSDLQEVMRDKELHLRTDIYEILLQDEIES